MSLSLTSRFSGDSPVSAAQGRNGELIVAQGNGVRPARWSGTGAAVDAGMDAPSVAPTITANGPAQYYVARIDVTKPGACYYAPPEVTFSLDGTKERECKAAAYLSQSSVSEVRVLDGGKGYTAAPSVELSDSHGKGASIVAVLDIPAAGPVDPTNNPQTGISQWEIVEQPPEGSEARFAGLDGVKLDIPIDGNGTRTVPTGTAFLRVNGGGARNTCNPAALPGWTTNITYTVSGWTSGTGAKLRLTWRGGQQVGVNAGFIGNCSFWAGATQVDKLSVRAYGAGYSDDSTITVTINAIDGDLSQKIVLRGFTAGNENNTEAPRYPVRELRITNGGSGYLVAPQLKFISNSGFGAYGTCKVKNGVITEVTLENSGGGYKTAPTVEIVSGGAEVFAVSRPHMRGTYQCYYRYVDDTPEDKGGPLPSNLSPVAELDAGEGTASLAWSFAAPSGRAKKAEVWRSTGDQATALYRVASVAGGSFVDSLTDDELRDPDREGYAAMPIVLPNGAVNANRFGVPPSDKAVVVRFQDRHWYGVDTSGKQPNTLYYSEPDEPESVPDSNEIILQQNSRDADSLRALVPFGSALLLMQERHSFSLTFARAPLLDAQVTPLAYRGCLNQRCWDIYGGVCYVLDQYGVYAITPTGQLETLSDQIDNLFRTAVDFSAAKWSFIVVDSTTKILRAFLPFREDNPSGYPTRVLCYSLDSKAWWYEKYPQRITGASPVRLSNGDYKCVYAGQSGPLLLDEGATDLARGSVVSVTLLDGGAGYRTPPTVTATGGSGASFQASVNAEGAVTGIWINSPGYGYAGGSLTISAPNDPTASSPRAATATYTATSLTADTPLFTTYRFRGGSAAFVSEAIDPKAAGEMQRGVTIAYAPQPQNCEVALRTYYNNAKAPRYNVAARNRGIGFTHSTVDAGARYDMAAPTLATGYDSGVATALFAGRTLSDVKSADRHISVELAGARKNPEPVVFYGLHIAGTLEEQAG